MLNVALHHSPPRASWRLCSTVLPPLEMPGGLAHGSWRALMGPVTRTSMVETSAIDAFLAGVLRSLRKGDAAQWPGEWHSSEALQSVWSRIEYHGIPVLLHEHADLIGEFPDTMLARVAEEARLIGLWETTHSAALAKLLKALGQAGIASVLMKGTALAYSLYCEPAARRRGDSDLLVRPADLEGVRETLTACGWYRNDDPHGLVKQEGWLCDVAGHFVHALDLHWASSDRPVLQKVLTMQDFFDRRAPLPRLSPDAYGADPVLTLVHETLNQKWHETHGYWAEEGRVKGGRRLIWSMDFDLLARNLSEEDWERLVSLCQDRGVGPLVAEALEGAAGDLGTPLRDAALESLASQPINPDIAAYFATTDSIGEFWLDLRTAGSWNQRIDMIRDRGFPPRAHLVEKYPRQSGWPTALLQGKLLVETAGRMLRRAVGA